MTQPFRLPGIRFDSERMGHRQGAQVPSIWPPPDNFPVVVDAHGKVVSRFGESSWNLGAWAGKSCVLSFGDGVTKGWKINRPNADLYRQIIGWWLWGPHAVRSVGGLKGRYHILKPIFVICTENGILASDLYKYPKVIEQVALQLNSRVYSAISYLNFLWAARDTLGFYILDESGLKRLASLATPRKSIQTAYIPPRIWTYQVLRLRECIDDYLRHREQIEACYRFCLDAYATNAGGTLEKVFLPAGRNTLARRAPFNPKMRPGADGDYVYHGAFRLTAARFGIEELLHKWVNLSDAGGVRALSSYMSLVSAVGLAYTINFSLMRIDEGSSLRADCYEIERDPLGEDIHLIGGPTTKTIKDGDARWIVSSSVKAAVDAMTSVAFLRIEAAKHDFRISLTEEDSRNPLLQTYAYEPWAPSSRTFQFRKKYMSFAHVRRAWPKLIDNEQLKICADDLAIARRLTFGLDPSRYDVGKAWPLAWHQVRRTVAVNMLASGLVTEASLQYQLKHATRAMSRYYGQNYHVLKVHLDDDARGYYLSEMYQSVVRQFQDLLADRFLSPYGDKRKAQITAPISERDHASLLKDAEEGRVSYRKNFLGGCAKQGKPCPLGGISNISGCMGFGSGKPCEDLIIDRESKPVIVELRDAAIARRAEAPPGSPLSESLQAQIESAERALHVIANS